MITLTVEFIQYEIKHNHDAKHDLCYQINGEQFLVFIRITFKQSYYVNSYYHEVKSLDTWEVRAKNTGSYRDLDSNGDF